MDDTSPVMSYGGESWYMKDGKVDRVVIAIAVLCTLFLLWAICTKQQEGLTVEYEGFYIDPNNKEGFYIDPNNKEGFYLDPNNKEGLAVKYEGFSGSHDNVFAESYFQRNGLPTTYSGVYGYGQNTPR
jgi:hypothetical protein